MGGGAWTTTAFNTYTTTTRGMDAATYATCDNIRVQDAYKARRLHADLNPKNVMRECLDTEEHPNTIPVILALDVTGSMGKSALEVSKKLGVITESIYNSDQVSDVEFCVMAIGDLYCDNAPVQMSQFESDVRIAEHLDKVWFEGGGGGNAWESYTAAWYMGLNHCKLDCWKRGKKGIIITMGDEKINPCLRKNEIAEFIGDSVQADVDTESLYEQVKEKFDVHHIAIDDPSSCYSRYNRNGGIDEAWSMLGENYHVSTVNGLQDMIASIVIGDESKSQTFATNEISW